MKFRLPVLIIILGGLCLPVQLAAEITVETPVLSLKFNEQGSLLEVSSCYPGCGQQNSRTLQMSNPTGIISFGQSVEPGWVQRRGLDGDVEGEQQVHFNGPGGQSISWKIPSSGYVIEVLANGTSQLNLRAGENFRPRPAAGFGGWLEQVRYVGVGSEGVQQIGPDDEETDKINADWGGFRSRFWTVLSSGEEEGEFELRTGVENTTVEVQRGGNLGQGLHSFYIGPVEPRELSAADELLSDMLYAGLWFWLRWICFGLYYLLGLIQSMVPIWGVAIMLLSLAVNILMLPLSRIADQFQQQVNQTEARLAPELSRIKKNYKGEEQAAKILAMYKTERVHPLYSLKSLIGVAVVIPIFIGAFDMLAENIQLLDTGFLWIKDLSRPDAWLQLPFVIPFLGSDVNLLPFVMTGLSFFASLLHKPLVLNAESRHRQVRNMILLAALFFVLFYTFPAGMVLYWTTNNLISVTKSLWVRRKISPATHTGNDNE
jgi:YidC/Oxa1 family membrane protein insertase